MEQCGREMSRGNSSDSGIKYLVAAAHSAEKSLSRNPFDEQFSFAARNKITRLVTSNVGSSSPLNTPSISLTDNGTYLPLSLDLTATVALPTPFSIIPDSATDFLKTPKFPEIKIEQQPGADQHNNNRNLLNDISHNSHPHNSNYNNDSSSPINTNGNSKPACVSNVTPPVILVPNLHDKTQKSNAVSVICQSSKPSENDELSSDIHKNFIPHNVGVDQDQALQLKTTYLVGNKLVISGQPQIGSSSLGPLLIALPNQNDASNQSSHSNSSHNSLPGMIKEPESIQLSVPLLGKKKKKISTILPGGGHRKEKTIEEMLKKIKDTEESLPPKAKPGRKSKGSIEDESDRKERKRRSLERNRAAAMRCRMKKKKEVNSLKERCDIYQEENERLRQLVVSLQEEVQSLKTKLLARDGSC